MPGMDDKRGSTERKVNLWAPWRMEYIETLSAEDQGCFLCRCRDAEEAHDAENLVVWRGRECFVVLNRYPYAGGHAMIAPLAHAAALDELPASALTEMMTLLRDTRLVLERVVQAQGFNVGMNIGRCAGAGLPGHLHMHIVPRWAGDTNFMAVFGDVRVIPKTLQALWKEMRAAGAEMGLPEWDA